MAWSEKKFYAEIVMHISVMFSMMALNQQAFVIALTHYLWILSKARQLIYLRVLAGIILQIAFYALFLLGPVPGFDWPDATAWLGTYFVINLATSFWITAKYPSSMEARLEFSFQRQPREDRLATLLLISALCIVVSMNAIDVFYLKFFWMPSQFWKISGLAISIVGYLIIVFTIIQNEFAQSVVNIQDDRNQVLIDKGLYAVVRHPMYLGLLVWLFGMSLWLGSIATALFGNAILFLALLPRILIEEKTLAINLEGYEDYMDRVQSRIIPQIF